MCASTAFIAESLLIVGGEDPGVVALLVILSELPEAEIPPDDGACAAAWATAKVRAASTSSVLL
jgi:hypothetical protein